MELLIVLKRVGSTAYKLDISHRAALIYTYSAFYVNLMQVFFDNGLDQQPPPIEVGVEAGL